MIVIVDYGLGNLGSIKNMLKKVGFESIISGDIEDIKKATKLILPGVGSFDQGMTNLTEGNFIDVLNQKVLVEKTPILGICLGMQLFTHGSEEGVLPGLGWVKANTIRFNVEGQNRKFSIPHMGWQFVHAAKDSAIVKEMHDDPKFYFVHSYYVRCTEPRDVLFTSNYMYDFHSGFEVDNIIGVQFHPEKSHKYGMRLLSNFVTNY